MLQAPALQIGCMVQPNDNQFVWVRLYILFEVPNYGL